MMRQAIPTPGAARWLATWGAAVASALLAGGGCSDGPASRPAGTGQTEPEATTAAPATRPAETPPVTEAVATAPAETRPADTQTADTLPESTYDSRPPYPVQLYVLDPKQKQPGWIEVRNLADDKTMATAKAQFPEQNRIYVQTQNVEELRIEIGHLPLAPKKRIILRIDEQGIEIVRRPGRHDVFLRRSHTGVWSTFTPSEE